MKVIWIKKNANIDYEIYHRLIAGVQLLGWEVKSLKSSSLDLSTAYICIENNEAYVRSATINPPKSLIFSNAQIVKRDRKLLLKRNEIYRILSFLKEKKGIVVPLKCFISDKGLIKFEIGLCKVRKKFDKRRLIKEKEIEKEIRSNKKIFF
ncbi:MAG: SsrA-binding protein [Candidatus Dojkabacteria bacterium]|nr:SsrA-binding protein [Candidatus Dojkabacteria bacterium]